ncbi:MAG: hypothetical protein JSV85_00325 [Candidatus Bathyarchaeota archaeon]|nr:MAG: hypothetical protein JSV85_00325 [Candidatus Bathyarchaeota archaeon]
MTRECQRETELSCADCRSRAKRNTRGKTFRAGLLRLLGMNRGFEESFSVQEKISNAGFPANSYLSYGKESENALLEAERKRAKAQEWQRRRFIC